jgi:hypothetical protein
MFVVHTTLQICICAFIMFHVIMSLWHAYGILGIFVCVCINTQHSLSCQDILLQQPNILWKNAERDRPMQVKPNATPNVAQHNKTYTARKGLGLLTAMPTREYIASNQLHNNPTCSVSMIVNSFTPNVRNEYNVYSKIPLTRSSAQIVTLRVSLSY